MKTTLFAVLLSVLSFAALAGEDKMFFKSLADCQSAKDAKYYTPALDNPAPGKWKRHTLKFDQCVNMMTVQGFFFVRLQAGTEMAQHPLTSTWHHSKCTNLTRWEPSREPDPVAQPAPAAPAACTNCFIEQQAPTLVRQVIKQEVECQDWKGNTFRPDSSGKCNFPEVQASTHTVVQNGVRCSNCNTRQEERQPQRNHPQQPQASNECRGDDCRPKPSIDWNGYSPRNDSRCMYVIHSPSTGKTYNLRIEKEKTGDITLAKTADQNGDQEVSRVKIGHESRVDNYPSCAKGREYIDSHLTRIQTRFELPNDCKFAENLSSQNRSESRTRQRQRSRSSEREI
jgi:hypothetical protein